MPLNVIERLLKQRMGLHSATVGSSTVAQAVEQRMLDCGISHSHDYLRIIRHSDTELDALIEAVIIPETWFYRDQHPFNGFSEWVSRSWLAHKRVNPLRILSVPCSSGEEPYTLAMCLADLGLPAKAAQIDAIDISHRNIELAGAASYGSNSFRSKDLDFRKRHFASDGPCFKLDEDIRRRVNFFRANILDEAFMRGLQPYHVIFCRNLLIYFDRPTQNRVIEQLDKLLSADGILFLGHSEASLLLQRDFTALGYPRCFGFQRKPEQSAESDDTASLQSARPTPRQRPDVNSRTDVPRPFAGMVRRMPQEPGSVAYASADNPLGEAFRLADQGHLDEAAQYCEKLLRQQQHQAEAHFLLGLLREATGSIEDAAQMFRKTIYLEPDHYEALAHLGVICQQQGDAVSAQRFQQRATRARQRTRVGEKSK